jgi:Fe-S-cluster containining protein
VTRLTRSQMDAQMRELYDRIPAIPDCDGRCWTSCGPIGMSDRERQRIRQAGYKITPYRQAMRRVDTYRCEALDEGHRCAVYDLRPMVCRLWGAVEGLPCVYGCRPEGGYLTDAEGYWLISEAQRIGGGEHAQAVSVEEIGEVMSREHIRAELKRLHDRGQRGEQLRAGDAIPAAFRRGRLR